MKRINRLISRDSSLVIAVILLVLFAAAGGICGVAKEVPWSGYWWPMKPGPGANLFDDGGPCEKYDSYVQATTGSNPGLKNWEKSNHDSPSAGSWWGHCHAWAAASILDDEPTTDKTKEGITFTVGDQKGLLTECHFDDPVDLWVGTRCNGGTGPSYQDVYALDFHRTLIEWLSFEHEEGEEPKREAVVFDIQPGAQVWNYPAYLFTMEFTDDENDPNKTHVECVVWLADDGVAPDYVGTKKFEKTYTYWLKPKSNPTSGGWEGSSINDHPDFIWHPAYQQEDYGCPIDYNTVKTICQ